MPDRIDEFESIFRSADKPVFHFEPPNVRKILLMSDLSGNDAQTFEERVRHFVESGEPGGTITWEAIHGEIPGTQAELINLVKTGVKNHNDDDGSLNSGEDDRQVTGIFVT